MQEGSTPALLVMTEWGNANTSIVYHKEKAKKQSHLWYVHMNKSETSEENKPHQVFPMEGI